MQRRISVGTTPTLLANADTSRVYFHLLFIPSSIEAGNTGTIYVLKGGPPTAATGFGNSGDAITQSASITDSESFPNDPSVYKGQWWALATVAAQVVMIDEMTRDQEGGK